MEFLTEIWNEIDNISLPSLKETERLNLAEKNGNPVLFRSGQITGQYLKLQAVYRYLFGVYLRSQSGLGRLDERLKERGFLKAGEDDMDYYQRYDYMGMDYLYLRSYVHIERLTTEQIELLRPLIGEGKREQELGESGERGADESEADESEADERGADEHETDESEADEYETDGHETDEREADGHETDEYETDECASEKRETDIRASHIRVTDRKEADIRAAARLVEETFKKVLAVSSEHPDRQFEIYPSVYGEGIVRGAAVLIGLKSMADYDGSGMLADEEEDQKRIRTLYSVGKQLETILSNALNIEVVVITEI
ncbi:hypothetical protein GPL15_04520 [Clostridium sp. MCC353]|uniref:hypothetical protein n=1 Tax=Clostridium sp. MCC353 TaxID=2592646 RepID=UPI001C028EB7|nr:hypothetical protein [Clostridium sp. MCC353]MBT9775776.1 hypothetical protein [Clostridium sp. MCC353]